MNDIDITNVLPNDLREAIEAADRAFDIEMFLEDLLREEPDQRIEAAWRTARTATDAALAKVAELKQRYGLP